jgi:acetyl-CoA synthetase (ADP-forming)
VLVQEMVGGSRELIAGLISDPQFGPCVMVGMGGVFSEVVADRSFRAAPVDAAEALDMIGELERRAVLGPFRGMPACDLKKVADLVVRLGTIGCDHPDIAEIDINPLIVSGAVPIAVDAIIALGKRQASAGRP